MNKNKRKLYTSPQAEVIETPANQVLCLSNTERPTDETPDWDWV